MTRIFIISLTASLVALWVVSAKAEAWHGNSFFYPSSAAHTRAPYNPPLHVWPRTNHEPAIGKTLTPHQSIPAPSEPSADYQYEWQHQPAPPAPYLAAPQQFSYPQQGYYPREGKVEQAPGYEYDGYDFGGTGSYPPMVPMEGASWVAPRAVNGENGENGLHAPQPFRHSSGFETHYGCVHW